jgi:hypothetical protein
MEHVCQHGFLYEQCPLTATCQASGKQMKRSERDVVEQNNLLQSMAEVAHLFAEYHST